MVKFHVPTYWHWHRPFELINVNGEQRRLYTVEDSFLDTIKYQIDNGVAVVVSDKPIVTEVQKPEEEKFSSSPAYVRRRGNPNFGKRGE